MKQSLAAVDNVMFAKETHAVHIINADVTGKFCMQSHTTAELYDNLASPLDSSIGC